jgi:predicted unusual protein kinase regulating ubiquinone biosynthesis (AarF/ABC1/UbiB family)
VATVEVDQTQVNRLFLNLVRIGEKHGIKFPREFGLFLKQILYFDRYTRILAPSLQVSFITTAVHKLIAWVIRGVNNCVPNWSTW